MSMRSPQSSTIHVKSVFTGIPFFLCDFQALYLNDTATRLFQQLLRDIKRKAFKVPFRNLTSRFRAK